MLWRRISPIDSWAIDWVRNDQTALFDTGCSCFQKSLSHFYFLGFMQQFVTFLEKLTGYSSARFKIFSFAMVSEVFYVPLCWIQQLDPLSCQCQFLMKNLISIFYEVTLLMNSRFLRFSLMKVMMKNFNSLTLQRQQQLLVIFNSAMKQAILIFSR